MKKLFLLLMSAGFVFAILSCGGGGGGGGSSSVVGSWEVASLDHEWVVGVYVDIYANGTGQINYYGEVENGAWSLSGNYLRLQTLSGSFALEGTLIWKSSILMWVDTPDGHRYVFCRSGSCIARPPT